MVWDNKFLLHHKLNHKDQATFNDIWWFNAFAYEVYELQVDCYAMRIAFSDWIQESITM